MERHFSPKFWHYGYENETELHVFVHGGVLTRPGVATNVYGIFFGYADRRNERGEVGGRPSLDRAQLGAMTRVLDIVKDDPRVVHIHTANLRIVDRLETWIPLWRKKGFTERGDDSGGNYDLIDALAKFLQNRTKDIFFESIYQPAKVAGCSLAIDLATGGSGAGALCPEMGDITESGASTREPSPASSVSSVSSRGTAHSEWTPSHSATAEPVVPALPSLRRTSAAPKKPATPAAPPVAAVSAEPRGLRTFRVRPATGTTSSNDIAHNTALPKSTPPPLSQSPGKSNSARSGSIFKKTLIGAGF